MKSHGKLRSSAAGSKSSRQRTWKPRNREGNRKRELVVMTEVERSNGKVAEKPEGNFGG